MPRFSICVPIYDGMENGWELLQRNLNSIVKQTFTDYEIVISDDSDTDFFKIKLYKYPVKYFRNTGSRSMAGNTNNAIDHAEGELIKILYQDDFFMDSDSLERIDRNFNSRTQWLVTACAHTVGEPHYPYYSESDNTIGSPSVLTFRREIKERFDLKFHWVLDLDLYRRLFAKHGKPKILNDINVVIGIHPGQKTHKLSHEAKALEHKLLKEKYDTRVKA